MQSDKGNEIANQFLIYFERGTVFQSYDSIIAIELQGSVYLTKDWDYSRTTGKYRNLFLGEGKKETDKNIKEGIYKIVE